MIVDGHTYAVRGEAVSGVTNKEPINPEITTNARFTARVLDEHILRSEQNKIRYSPISRALVYADASAPRLLEPWLRSGSFAIPAEGDSAAAARQRFKEWVLGLANNPKELALAIARMDYIHGVRAYRENAAIYRKVTIKKELLTYDEALKFFQNQEKVLRIGEARKLEARLMDEAAAAAAQSGQDQNPNAAGQQQADSQQAQQQAGGQDGSPASAGAGQQGQSGAQAGQLQQQLQEVASQADHAQSHSDLETTSDKVREIVEQNREALRSNSDLERYASANTATRSEFQQQAQAYRQGEQSSGNNSAAGSDRAPQFDFPVLGGYLPGGSRYTARPAPAPKQSQQQANRNPNGVPSGRADNSQSTITGEINRRTSNPAAPSGGVTGTYRQVTRDQANTIIRTYKSIPGGITLEGSSADFAFVRAAVYEPSANAIILNNDIVYLSPVSASELAEILRAINGDPSMGVSLSSNSSIVYGKLAPLGRVAVSLKLADEFLGSLTWGQTEDLKGYRFAPGYEGLRPTDSTGPLAVYFNINDFRFSDDPSGEMMRSAAKIDITLVPLSDKKGSDGGHVPDLDRINRGDVPPEYVKNATHVQDNISYYGRERIVRMAFAYGEVAAFARSIKSRGVNLEQLARSVDPSLSPGLGGTPTAATSPTALSPAPSPVPNSAARPKNNNARAAPPAERRATQESGEGQAARRNRDSGDSDDMRRMKAQCREAVRAATAAGFDNGRGIIAAARSYCGS